MKLTRKKDDQLDVIVDHPPFVRALPTVNLVPAAVTESIAVRKIRRGFIAGFLLLLVIGTGIWLLQNGSILTAQTELDSARAENTALSAQVQALAPVEQLYKQITTQEEFITGALASEAVTSDVVKALAGVGGPNVEFTNIAVTYTGIPKPEKATSPETALNQCPNADPFGKEITIGCLTFTARTKDRGEVSRFLARATRPPFVGTYVTDTTVGTFANGKPAITFSGSAGISPQALKTKLTEEQIQKIIDAAKPKPAPSGEPSPSASVTP